MQEAKHLGVTLDEKLSLNNHVMLLKQKLVKIASSLKLIKHYVPYKANKQLYYVYVHSTIYYGFESYGYTSQKNMKQLRRLQNKTVWVWCAALTFVSIFDCQAACPCSSSAWSIFLLERQIIFWHVTHLFSQCHWVWLVYQRLGCLLSCLCDKAYVKDPCWMSRALCSSSKFLSVLIYVCAEPRF